MKPFEFKEYTATTEDADGDQHESKVNAAVIGKDHTGREVNTLTGQTQTREGDVLVETARPGVYDVLSKDVWEKTGYAGGDGQTDTPVGPDRGVERGAQTGGTDKTSASRQGRGGA
jgi:hypothetical protein